jgi:uncharacterized protein YndB with AHSA1/START domain
MENKEKYTLKVEKTFQKPIAEVFRAISEGRLFQNCGGDSQSMEIDFRVGGKYRVEFKSHGLNNFGEFKEIILNKKITFTWCASFEEPRIPNTLVTIELTSEGSKTHLKLVHAGFDTVGDRDAHQQGWNGGLTDLTQEIENGRVRMVRVLPMPISKLFETCKTPQTFFGLVGKVENFGFKPASKFQIQGEDFKIDGEFLEIEENKKIVLRWVASYKGSDGAPTRVSMIFDDEEDNEASIELIHEGLTSESILKTAKKGWEFVLNALLAKSKAA